MSASKPETDAPESQSAEQNAAPSLHELFIACAWLGVTAFGGPAMVVYIRQLVVDRSGWLNARAFDDGGGALPNGARRDRDANGGIRWIERSRRGGRGGCLVKPFNLVCTPLLAKSPEPMLCFILP